MNDSEIIKGFCKRKLCEPALEIINRQQTEIDTMKDTMAKLLNTLERANKYGLGADERIEQLKIELEKAKSEAVREFAKRLKKFAVTERVRINQRRHVDVSYVRVYDIDRLVEEMGCNDG